jgi:hypothetical protein
MQHLRTPLDRLLANLRTAVRDERGDIPGWVLVTLMTAGIVAVIWGVAQDQLQAILEGALDNVTPG